MGDPLHDRRPLEEWVSGEQAIEISGSIEDFERLADAVRADLGEARDEVGETDLRNFAVSGRLQFARAGLHGDRASVTGGIEAELPATCQRCLKTFRLAVSTELKLELIEPQDGGEGGLPEAREDGFEAWEMTGEAVRPADIVDEALVMAIPLVAKHVASDDCVEIDAAPEGPEMTSPFASLRAQMDEAKKD